MKRKVLAALLCSALLGTAPVYAAENQVEETLSVSENAESTNITSSPSDKVLTEIPADSADDFSSKETSDPADTGNLASADVSVQEDTNTEKTAVLSPGFQVVTDENGETYTCYVTSDGTISRGNHTTYAREHDTVSWLTVNSVWYLVDTADGHLLSGWQTVAGSLYYLRPDTFAMETGNQSRGGWAVIDGQWYSFRSWGGARTGWYSYGGCWYYLYADGHMENSSLTFNGKTYFFRSWGGMYTNTVVSSGNFRCYVQEDGTICTRTGWVKSQEKWYWIKDNSGQLAKSEWITYKNNRYYLKADSTMASSEWIDHTWYFNSWGGMCKNGWVKLNSIWYFLNADGTKHADGWMKYLNNWYYLENGGQMASDKWIYHANNWYYLKSWGGMCHDEWLVKDGASYYFRSWGGMYYSTTATIGDRQYTFDENGHKVSVQSEWTKLASGLKAAKTHNQLILVSASGSNATVAMVTKDADGTWSEDLCSNGFVGAGGVGDTTEWNHKTPRGQFGFTYAFGIRSNPGTKLPYTQVDDTYYWVDDVNSKYYNQFVTTKTTAKSWNSAEHIIEFDPAYRYALSLNYNPNCIPGVGSAIFLHCTTNRPTGGCIGVPEDQMVTILKNIQPGCQIIIDSASGLKNY